MSPAPACVWRPECLRSQFCFPLAGCAAGTLGGADPPAVRTGAVWQVPLWLRTPHVPGCSFWAVSSWRFSSELTLSGRGWGADLRDWLERYPARKTKCRWGEQNGRGVFIRPPQVAHPEAALLMFFSLAKKNRCSFAGNSQEGVCCLIWGRWHLAFVYRCHLSAQRRPYGKYSFSQISLARSSDLGQVQVPYQYSASAQCFQDSPPGPTDLKTSFRKTCCLVLGRFCCQSVSPTWKYKV